MSRETVEVSERVLKELMERRLDAWDLLVIYLDGIQMGSHHVLAAVGVDSDGKKHVLGVREGASENAEVSSALLEDLVEPRPGPGQAAAVRDRWLESAQKAIEKVFGQRHPIQRCRNHKLRNVLGHLPKDQHPQVKAAVPGGDELDASRASRSSSSSPDGSSATTPPPRPAYAKASARCSRSTGSASRRGWRKCLGSTNLIDSTHSGVRQKTRR